MLRNLHKLPALIAGLVVSFLAITGTILALQPLTEKLTTPQSAYAVESVATLAANVADNFAEPDRLVKTASGKFILYQQTDSGPAANLVDPATGADLGTYAPNAMFSFVTELHRSLMLGDNGRLVTLIAALAMLTLTLSGIILLARRMGGWRHFFAIPKGTLSQKLHVELARFGLIAFTILGLSGMWMSASYFGWIGSSADSGFLDFAMSSDGTPMAISDMSALAGITLNDLRELTFPALGDTQDVFSITTAAGSGFVDQVTGGWVSFTPNSIWETIYQYIYLLHTGEGVWWYALMLGASALLVPVLALTGTVIWWRRRAALPRIKGNAHAQKAKTVILVGSEGQSTWGFAAELFERLKQTGQSVHIAPMNQLARHYSSAKTLLVLTATYGDGQAPASAKNFMTHLDSFSASPNQRFAVLGFGDRSFAKFCAFAHDTQSAMQAKGLSPLIGTTEIDRQSSQQFARWGEKLGAALAVELKLTHQPAQTKTSKWVLVSREDYGQEYQTPKSVLRFKYRPSEKPNLWQRVLGNNKRFAAGDLIGITPPATQDMPHPAPRFYSVASSDRDGYLDICVSKQPGGLCSTYLCELQPGDEIDAFIKTNGDFRAPRGNRPFIMIGAGTGVAPFIGITRANTRYRPAFLYYGARNPNSDFIFGAELEAMLADGRLKGLRLAFSRIGEKAYVQDRLREDADLLIQAIRNGAQIMVCGSLTMAQSVAETVDDILEPLNLDAATLRAKGRYLEDVYQ